MNNSVIKRIITNKNEDANTKTRKNANNEIALFLNTKKHKFKSEDTKEKRKNKDAYS